MTVADLIRALSALPPDLEAVTVDAAGGVTALTGPYVLGYATHDDEPVQAVCVGQDLDGTLGWELPDANDPIA